MAYLLQQPENCLIRIIHALFYYFRHPSQPGMFAQPEMQGLRPRMPGPLSPHAQGHQGSFGVPPGPMPPPKPPTPGTDFSFNVHKRMLSNGILYPSAKIMSDVIKHVLKDV